MLLCRGSALLLDPVALVVLLVLILHGAPGYPVSAALLPVVLLGGIERLLVDLLGVLGQVVLTLSGRSVILSYGIIPPSPYKPKRKSPAGRRVPRSRCRVGSARLLVRLH